MVWLSVLRVVGKHNANQWHTSFTKCKPMPNRNKRFGCEWVCKPVANFVQTEIEYTSVSAVRNVLMLIQG